MINIDRDREYHDRLARRPLYKRIVGATQETAGGILGRLTSSDRVAEQPRFSYGLPLRGRFGPYFDDPSVLTAIENLYGSDLIDGIKNLVTKERENREGKTIFDASSDTLIRQDVLFRVGHSRDLAREAVLSDRENSLRFTGLEALMSEVLKRVGRSGMGSEFTEIQVGNKRISLMNEDGSLALLPDIFDNLRKPIPAGTHLRIVGSDRVLDVTILPTPSGFKKPYVCLLGSPKAENGSLSKVMVKSKARQQRVVVVYKQGDEGLVRAFIQPSDDTDVVEVLPEKRRVDRVNGAVSAYHLPVVLPRTNQVVLMPVAGQIESYVSRKLPLPLDIPDTAAVFGIDVVQSGRSMMMEGIVPIEFRKGRIFVPAKQIRDWYGKKIDKFHSYVRRTSIMPVHMIAVCTKMNSSMVEEPKKRNRFGNIFRHSKK